MENYGLDLRQGEGKGSPLPLSSSDEDDDPDDIRNSYATRHRLGKTKPPAKTRLPIKIVHAAKDKAAPQ